MLTLAIQDIQVLMLEQFMSLLHTLLLLLSNLLLNQVKFHLRAKTLCMMFLSTPIILCLSNQLCLLNQCLKFYIQLKCTPNLPNFTELLCLDPQVSIHNLAPNGTPLKEGILMSDLKSTALLSSLTKFLMR